MGKKEDKQFPLTNKKNCAVYLNRIISSCERCMDRLKKYNVEGNKLLVEYMGKDVVPHEVYVELLDKTSSVIMYLLNLLGDAQTSSISYFKFHKHISKHPIADVRLNPLEDETRELLNDFNRMRNWQNHIPESLLVAEMEQVEAGKMTLPMDPVSIIVYKNVSYAAPAGTPNPASHVPGLRSPPHQWSCFRKRFRRHRFLNAEGTQYFPPVP